MVHPWSFKAPAQILPPTGMARLRFRIVCRQFFKRFCHRRAPCWSAATSSTSRPVCRAAFPMRQGEDLDRRAFDSIDDAEWEFVQKEPAGPRLEARPSPGRFSNMENRSAKLRKESPFGLQAPLAVPGTDLSSFIDGFRMELEFDQRRHRAPRRSWPRRHPREPAERFRHRALPYDGR